MDIGAVVVVILVMLLAIVGFMVALLVSAARAQRRADEWNAEQERILEECGRTGKVPPPHAFLFRSVEWF